VAARAARHLDGQDQRPVGAPPAAVERLAAVLEPLRQLPEESAEVDDVIQLLDEVGSPATTATTGRRYFGFVTGGTLPGALAAAWLSTAWDQNGAMRIMSPVSAHLEEMAIEWLISLLGLPAGSSAALTTGATMANFVGLAAARHAVLARAGWDVESQGLFGAPALRVVVGEEAHVSLFKTLAMLGLGRDRVERVPVDQQGRMRPDALPQLDERTILCLQAGNVNTGALDPAEPLCGAARQAGAWVHVDGAFGLWAMAVPSLQYQARGYELADSWATDGHKWLNVSYDCGIAFVRDAAALSAAMSANAAYLTSSGGREAMNCGPESSRRARGTEVWAALATLGRRGVVELIERCCRHARRFAEGLRAAGVDVWNDVQLNQVLVSFGEDALTRAVIAGVQAEGTCWCGSTVWRGRAAMRISVSSWATTEDDVERSLTAILKVWRTAQYA
jgi:glutamate/tyrosine decarboxylase-like PLP-dependent enzyme